MFFFWYSLHSYPQGKLQCKGKKHIKSQARVYWATITHLQQSVTLHTSMLNAHFVFIKRFKVVSMQHSRFILLGKNKNILARDGYISIVCHKNGSMLSRNTRFHHNRAQQSPNFIYELLPLEKRYSYC